MKENMKLTPYPLLVGTLIVLVSWLFVVHLIRSCPSCSGTLLPHATTIGCVVATIFHTFWWMYVAKKDRKKEPRT